MKPHSTPLFWIARPLLLCATLVALTWAATASAASSGKIVIIGGKKSHGAGEHDFPNGIPLFAAQIKASPTFAGMEVMAYTTGWPAEPDAFDHASTIVFYFDGVTQKPAPLLDPARIAQMQKAIDAGVGFACIFQASTVPTGNTTIPLMNWLGERRDGMFDRTFGTYKMTVATPAHPISSGLSEFDLKDEFHPTLIFVEDSSRITPILTAPIAKKDPKDRLIAWTYDRPNGGRSFGFPSGHFLRIFTEPPVEKLMLNAIAWTAHLPIPAGGVETTDPVMSKAVVTKANEATVLPQPWGSLTWYTSAAQKNSEHMTTGLAVIKPGQSNPRHFHPNCDEILHVISGKIRNTMNEVSVEMNPGDTVTIPAGVIHNATNLGTEDAVLAICYSSAHRETVGE